MQDACEIAISQMLSSRLCHDLIAPLSAVKTGLELLEDSQAGACDSQVVELVMQSADVLSRRLSFFRFAFGYSAVDGVKSLDDVRAVLDAYFDPKKHRLSWLLERGFMESTAPLKHWAKLIVNLISLCVDATPYGGKIEALFDEAGDLSVRVEGRTANLQPAVKGVLEQGCPASEATAHTVQAYLCYYWLHMLGKRLVIEEGEGRLLLKTLALGR